MRAVAVILIIVVGALIAFGLQKWFTRSGESKKALRKERDNLKRQRDSVRSLGYDLRITDPTIGDMILNKTKDERREETR